LYSSLRASRDKLPVAATQNSRCKPVRFFVVQQEQECRVIHGALPADPGT
jgi:hypothetical protein